MVIKSLNGLTACNYLKIFICYSSTTKKLLEIEMFGLPLCVKGHIMRVYNGSIYYDLDSVKRRKDKIKFLLQFSSLVWLFKL